MKTRYLFEFHDQPSTPAPIRKTILDCLRMCNSRFRPYNQQVSKEIIHICKEQNLTTVVELGAGHAPITRELASRPEANKLKLIPCDLYPETESWQELQDKHPDQVEFIPEPVDFLKEREWPDQCLLVIVAAFHHIPLEHRDQFIQTIQKSGKPIVVFEPIRKTLFSIFLSLFAVIPVLLTPLILLFRPGWLRRILWTWLIPVIPLMFWWDSVISCLRQWSPQEWEQHLAENLGEEAEWKIDSGPHHMVVKWSK